MKTLILLCIVCFSLMQATGEILRSKNSVEVERIGDNLWLITQTKVDSLTCDSIKRCIINRSFNNEAEVIYAPDTTVSNNLYLQAYEKPGEPIGLGTASYEIWENTGFPWFKVQDITYDHAVSFDAKSRKFKVNRDSFVRVGKPFVLLAFMTIMEMVAIILILIMLITGWDIRPKRKGTELEGGSTLWIMCVLFILANVVRFLLFLPGGGPTGFSAKVSLILAVGVFCLTIWDSKMEKKVNTDSVKYHTLLTTDAVLLLIAYAISFLSIV